jgi:hypothetical protein
MNNFYYSKLRIVGLGVVAAISVVGRGGKMPRTNYFLRVQARSMHAFSIVCAN